MRKWIKVCTIILVANTFGAILFCYSAKAESVDQGQIVEVTNAGTSENFMSSSDTSAVNINEIALKIEANDALITTLKENQKILNQSYKEKIADLKKNPKTNITKQDLELVKDNLKKVDSEQKKMEKDNTKIKKIKKKFDKYMKDSSYDKAEKEGKSIIEKQEYQLQRADNINSWFSEIMAVFQK